MRILIVLLDDFSGISRLPGALTRQGFQVAALCQAYTFLARTRFLDRQYRWPLLRHRSRVLGCLADAISDYDPQLVIPGDQRSSCLLRNIASGSLTDPRFTTRIIDLLRLSFGDAGHYEEQIFKGSTHAAAAALGLPVPTGRMVVNVDDAIAMTASIGYPVVLKRDNGAAGDGVRICADQASLRRSFSELEAPERRARPHLRLARWMRGRYLRDCHLGAQRPLNVERFVKGPVATRAVVAWDGAILDGFSLLRDIVHPEPLGPSSLVHFIDHGDMEAATSRLITRWRASGFFGFDFIIDHDDHHAYLLECNPRPVPISHIGGFGGHDLCAALAAKLIGTTARPAEPVQAERVALFPQEWRRDPMSPWLHDAYHDVPWDDIPLLRALCGKSR